MTNELIETQQKIVADLQAAVLHVPTDERVRMLNIAINDLMRLADR